MERDASNGENAAGDGRPISIRGTTYASGVGAHADGDGNGLDHADWAAATVTCA